jgi:hypothetical protein
VAIKVSEPAKVEVNNFHSKDHIQLHIFNKQ